MTATRRCKSCRKKVPADSIYQSHLKAFCSSECLLEYIRSPKGEKDRHKSLKTDLRERKAKLKTKSQWMKEAQAVFNQYVRWRDRNNPCISCGNFTDDNMIGGAWDCGHYRSVGSAPQCRFHLWNAHKQCVKCNRYLSGNVTEYRPRLLKKIGQDRLETIETMNNEKRFDIDYLKRLINIYKKKLKKGLQV